MAFGAPQGFDLTRLMKYVRGQLEQFPLSSSLPTVTVSNDLITGVVRNDGTKESGSGFAVSLTGHTFTITFT